MSDHPQPIVGNDGGPEQPKLQPSKITLKEVIAEVVKNGAQFFVNTKNEPVVFLPETPFQQYWFAGHDRVQSYLAAVYHDLSHGDYLRPSEQGAVISLLKDACYQGGRRLTELESPEAEKEPIIQAILYFMNCVESFEGMTATLLSKLNDYDVQRKVRGIDDFPVLTNIFSRRLKRLVPALLGLGVEVSIWHEEDGSHCRVKRLAGFVKEADALNRQASGDASGVTSKQGKNFVPADGSDGTERFDDVPFDGQGTKFATPTDAAVHGGHSTADGGAQ